MSDIKIFKLKNGDELIVTLIGGNNETYKVSKVRQLIMQQTDRGLGMGLFPWLGSAIDSELDIYKSSLLVVPFDVDKNLEDQYLQQTTGIAIAK